MPTRNCFRYSAGKSYWVGPSNKVPRNRKGLETVDLMAATMAHFLEILKAKSGGKVTYEYHPGGVMGSAREVHESMKGNAIQMFAGTVGGCSEAVPLSWNPG